MPARDETPRARPDARGEVLSLLRDYAIAYSELSRHAARAMGLHVTDTEALSDLISAEDGGRPLSPARLAERVGLTSGATNACINRLEAAGYLVRSRESGDRRVVTLRATASARERAGRFTGAPARELDAAFDTHPAAALETTDVVLRSLVRTLTSIDAELRAAARSTQEHFTME